MYIPITNTTAHVCPCISMQSMYACMCLYIQHMYFSRSSYSGTFMSCFTRHKHTILYIYVYAQRSHFHEPHPMLGREIIPIMVTTHQRSTRVLKGWNLCITALVKSSLANKWRNLSFHLLSGQLCRGNGKKRFPMHLDMERCKLANSIHKNRNRFKTQIKHEYTTHYRACNFTRSMTTVTPGRSGEEQRTSHQR